MLWTRRKWMMTAGVAPLHAGVAAAVARQADGDAPEQETARPPMPASLPDKASFAAVGGTYLNAASSHPRSAGSLELIRRASRSLTGETNGFQPDADRVLADFARLINADPADVMFLPSTQVGEAYIAAALGLPAPGAHVVTDVLHFVGAHMMYTDMKARGLEVTWVDMDKGRVSLDAVDRAIVRGRTKLVAVSSTSMMNGFEYDMRALCEIAHAKGAHVHADAIQSVGNSPVDVRAWGVDSLSAASYKWLMSAGTAFFYVSPRALGRLAPPFYHLSRHRYPPGGMNLGYLPDTHLYPFDRPGTEVVDNYQPKPGPAGLFSTGYRPDHVTLAGLEYSLAYILHLGPANIRAHASALSQRLQEGLRARGYPMLTPEGSTAPIVTAAVRDAGRLAPAFDAAGVRVTTRWNHLRISPSVFNDLEDIERVLAATPAYGD